MFRTQRITQVDIDHARIRILIGEKHDLPQDLKRAGSQSLVRDYCRPHADYPPNPVARQAPADSRPARRQTT